MSKKEEKVETTSTEEETVETETTEEVVDDTISKDGTEEDTKDDGVDYKTLLEEEIAANGGAKKALAEGRYKASKNKKKENQDGDDVDTEADEETEKEEKPLTQSQLDRRLEQERHNTLKEVQAVQIQEFAEALSQSDAQKQLIIEIHKNRTFPAYMTLKDQIEEAFVIANKKKLISERNEAMRALKGKKSADTSTATTHRDAAPATEPKLSSNDAYAIKGAGFTWNGALHQFEKVLKNGSKLVRNPKTGKVSLVRKA